MSAAAEPSGWPTCDVCGVASPIRPITVTFSVVTELTLSICSLCQGLIDSGILRAETVDGGRRYRQWFPEWKPGALLPKVPAGCIE